MNWTPLWQDGPVISTHALAALFAMLLGAIQLLRPKGTPSHIWLGRLWVGIMALVAGSSFFIWQFRTFGPFSPIHLLSALTLGSLYVGVRAARAGQIGRHRKIMRALYLLALLLTGDFTLLPGRTMHTVVFGG